MAMFNLSNTFLKLKVKDVLLHVGKRSETIKQNLLRQKEQTQKQTGESIRESKYLSQMFSL